MSDVIPDVREIFCQAIEIAGDAERVAFIARVCGGDLAKKVKIEALLNAHQKAGNFLGGAEVDTTDQPRGERAGTRVGSYKLLQKIGEGGMGVVWVAEQEQPIKRRVALKVIKPGMDTSQVIARFEAERQALALMDHTNIAKVLDGGATESGRTYFVMELVKGVPITKYCDELNLSIRERLALFVPVCKAIQHAHQKGIIHRDLKPSNVLVAMQDGVPVPKVIDFGVAKALHQPLTERTMMTEFGAVVGTLEYMSPEQAELSALDIDTRADVYTLGVLMYELLTGSTPLDRKRLKTAALDEVLRMIREVEPPRPSTRLTTSEDLPSLAAHRRTEPFKLNAEVRGDLDWIVMKALEKDRIRRYETVNGLARDVERFLNDEPVEARPPSTAYRLHKAFRKHRLALVTTAAFVTVLLVGTIVSTYQAWRAEFARQVAERERQAANVARKDAESERENSQHALIAQEKATTRAQIAEQNANDRSEQYLRQLYFTDMNLAAIALDSPSGGRSAQDTLAKWRPKSLNDHDLRGWEWYLLQSEVQHSRQTLDRDCPLCIAWHPANEELLACGYPDGTVRLYNLPAEGTHVVLARHAVPVRDLKWSGDGELLAVAAIDDEITVWNAATGGLECSIPIATMQLKWQANTRLLWATDREGNLRCFDAETGQQRAIWEGDTKVFDISDDGRFIAADSAKQKLVLLDLQSLEVLREFALPSQSSQLSSIQWRPRSHDLLAGGEGYPAWYRFYSINSPEPHRVGEIVGSRHVASWDPLGKYVAVSIFEHDAQEIAISLVDFESDRRISCVGHRGFIHDISWHPQGRYVASVSRDRTVIVWDVKNARPATAIPMFRLPVSGIHVAWNMAGNRLAVSTDALELLNVKNLDQSNEGPANSRWFCLDPTDSRLLVISGQGKRVRTWHLLEQREMTEAALEADRDLEAVAVSPDGRWLAAGSASGASVVYVWDRHNRRLIHSLDIGWRLLSRIESYGNLWLSWSPDSRHVFVAGSGTSEIVDFNVVSGHSDRRLASFPGGSNASRSYFALSPRGDRFVSIDGTYRADVFSTLSGKHVFRATEQDWEGGVSWLWNAAWDPMGQRFATTGLSGTIRVWDSIDKSLLSTLTRHSAEAQSVAWNPDGNRLASGDREGTIKVWDVTNGQEVLTRNYGPGTVQSLAWSLDGVQLIASVRGEPSLRILDASPAYIKERSAVALKRLDQSLRLSANNREMLKARAEVYLRTRSNYSKIRSDLETLLDSPRILGQLAQDSLNEVRLRALYCLALVSLGDSVQAVSAWQQLQQAISSANQPRDQLAKRAIDSDVPFVRTLGIMFQAEADLHEGRQLAESLAELAMAMEKNSQRSLLWYKLGEMQRQAGAPTDACVSLRRSIETLPGDAHCSNSVELLRKLEYVCGHNNAPNRRLNDADLQERLRDAVLPALELTDSDNSPLVAADGTTIAALYRYLRGFDELLETRLWLNLALAEQRTGRINEAKIAYSHAQSLLQLHSQPDDKTMLLCAEAALIIEAGLSSRD